MVEVWEGSAAVTDVDVGERGAVVARSGKREGYVVNCLQEQVKTQGLTNVNGQINLPFGYIFVIRSFH